jgi:hypothetical protein
MSDKRQHRGAHPKDEQLFASEKLPLLCKATAELSWLLSRGYAMKSALKLVGDRHNLTERQRLALSRAACSDDYLKRRQEKCLAISDVRDENLIVDGFNLIITVEAALSGGVLLYCRDSCIRDLSSVHGSYRSVRETEQAIRLIDEALTTLQPKSTRWLLDSPISNSGRLAQQIREIAQERNWDVETVFNPDAEILSSNDIAVTSDSIILDGVKRWINFNEYLVQKFLPDAWVIDLRTDAIVLSPAFRRQLL